MTELSGGSPVRPWRARAALIGVFAVFFVPVLASVVITVVAPGWTPFGSMNRGELVQPPQPVELGQVLPLDGGAPPSREREAVWMLVHAGGGACGEGCLRALVDMRQARLALGKDAGRVSRWWLVTEPPPRGSVYALREQYPGLRIGQIPGGSVLARRDDASPVQLVDPAGFLVLRYRGDTVASDILKDLKRLLKISKQG